jgi:hypothetical protein
MRQVIRLKHMRIRTAESYVQWAKRCILFHHKRHPADMGASDIRAFLTHLAVEGQVAVSTHNVVLQVLIFLYRHVRKQPCPELGKSAHARQSRRVPVVRAQQEVPKVLAHLVGTPHLLASLLYGAGLCLIDLYFSYRAKDFVAEAKQCWPRVGRRAQVAKAEVEYAFQSAIAAVQSAPEDYGRRLATVFASPRCPKSELPEAPRGLAKWKQAIEVVICNCKILYWPHNFPWAEDEGAIDPGEQSSSSKSQHDSRRLPTINAAYNE